MAYALYTQSFGTSNAFADVTITDSLTGKPATILASTTGGLVNTQGLAKLDASGVLNVYIDTAQTWTFKVSDGDTAAPSVVTSALPTLVGARRTVICGDSITAFNNASPVSTGQFANEGYAVWANIGLGGALDIVANAGIPGNRTSQLRARFLSDVLAYKPQIIIELCGTNDIASPLVSGVPTAGATLNTLGAVVIAKAVMDTVADIIANKTAYYNQALASGAQVFALSITPSSDWLGYQHGRDIWAQVTEWQRKFCLQTPGMIFVDAATAVVDPTSTASVPKNQGLDNDGLHFYTRSAQAVGAVLEEALRPFVPPAPAPLFVVDTAGPNNITGNVIPNPRWNGTGGTVDASVSATGTMPDGWQINAVGSGPAPVVVLSKVAHPLVAGAFVLQVQITFASHGAFQGVEVKPISALPFVAPAAGVQVDWDLEFRIVAANDRAMGYSMVMDDFTSGFSLLGTCGFAPTTVTLPIAPMAKLGRITSGRRPYTMGQGSALHYFKVGVYNSVNNVGTITFQLGRLIMRRRA